MRINLIRNLLRIGAVAGVGATAYFSAKNGMAICDAFKCVEEDYRFKEEPKGRVTHYIRNVPKLIKPLWPTILAGGGTIICMAISERINYKQIAALTATCVYLTKNRDFLEGKLKEVVGEERLNEIKKEFIVKEAPKMVRFPSVEETGNGDLLCLEGYSGRWFRSSMEACLEAQEKLIKQLDETRYGCMNDYYRYLGITDTHFGNEYGWAMDSGLYGVGMPKFDNSLVEPHDIKEDWIGPDGVNIEEPVYILEFPYYYYPIDHWLEY